MLPGVCPGAAMACTRTSPTAIVSPPCSSTSTVVGRGAWSGIENVLNSASRGPPALSTAASPAPA